jgi:serine protease Do
VLKKIKTLKGAGKKTALLIVANGQGDAQFVALPVE